MLLSSVCEKGWEISKGKFKTLTMIHHLLKRPIEKPKILFIIKMISLESVTQGKFTWQDWSSWMLTSHVLCVCVCVLKGVPYTSHMRSIFLHDVTTHTLQVKHCHLVVIMRCCSTQITSTVSACLELWN